MSARATAARDPRIVRAAQLLRSEEARRAERAFVVDGVDLLREALVSGVEVETVFAGDAAGVEVPGVEVVPASPDALRALAAVGQAPDVVAVCRTPDEPAPPLPAASLVLARVSDAGNVGSILRTAAALGLPRVTLTPGCADPWSRRALRAALGASFAPGLVATQRPLEELAALPDRPPLVAALPLGGVAPEDLPDGAVVVLGAERDGVAAAERACCDAAVTIPAPGFESLNVAAAAAILAWHLRPARRGR